jgi:hypothetical protein
MDNTEFSTEEIKGTITQIQHLITLIGENDNYADVLKSFDGIEADDVSISNVQELRNDFVQQLIEQLAEFKIHLQPSNNDKISDKITNFPISQAV